MVLSLVLDAAIVYALPATGKWNTEELYRTPQSWPCEAFAAKSNQLSVVTESGTVTARYVWLEGLAYKGKPTKFLACYAIPKAADSRSVPAMVCVHGGNGTAYREWVELWAKRGYAAIAMDTCGSIPVRVPGTKFDWISSGIGGPRGWGGFANVNDDIKDQWPYHAVSTVVRSHSFLRAQSGVDPERIGITGLSWGGFLTCLSAAVDKRFKLAVPVYTCAFYDTIGSAEERRKTLGDVKWRRWLDLWDPKHYIPEIDMPIMWLSGTNDRSFPYGSLRKTFPLVKVPLDVVIRPRMPHGHTAGGLKLPKVSAPTVAGNSTAVKFESGEGFMAPVAAELHYTTADGKWENRLWRCRPVKIEGSSAIADMPSGVTAHFINLVFENGLKVSSR